MRAGVSFLALLATFIMPSAADAAQNDGTSRYGPLAFNKIGSGDFYISQDGKFAPAELVNGVIEFHLHAAPFELGYNGEQVNICLALKRFDEIRADPQGNKASCLSGAATGANKPSNNDNLFVYSGENWSDGNTILTNGLSMPAKPEKGYDLAFKINRLTFVDPLGIKFEQFKGPIFGYIVVYKQSLRMDKDIMPIELIIE